MRKVRMIEGEFYRVRFVDHNIYSKNDGSYCQVVGKFVEENKDYMTFSWWQTFNDEEYSEEDEENKEFAKVAKKLITQIKKIRMPK